jgi:hypothetical protein
MIIAVSSGRVPERSSVSIEMTEHGNAGKLMLMLMRIGGEPLDVSTYRCSTVLTCTKSTSSIHVSSKTRTMVRIDTIPPVSVR